KAYSVLHHPGVLGTAALRRVDYQRTFTQCHTRQAARYQTGFTACQDERAQVDMTRGDAALDEGRAGRQAQRRLGDVGLRAGLEAFAEGLDLGLARRRTDQHAVAAGTL